MPVRDVYGIRTSLGKSPLDSQIQLDANTSLSFAKKPITLATFFYLMGAIVIYALIVSKTVVSAGGFWGWLFFTVGYVGLYWSMLTRTKTLNYKLSYLPVFAQYWGKGARRVKTGLLDNGAPLRNFFGIREKNGVEDSGLIHFTDGEVGVVFDVVGNASSMIFEQDQVNVIKDARTIYKNLPSMIGLTLITQASTQDVHTQIESKLDQLHALQIDSPGLRQIVKKQGQVLRDTVGTNFSMIRQYLLVRGGEDNVMQVAKTLSDSAASSTNNYLKSATLLTNEKLKKYPNGMPANEPRQVQRLLESIFDDYDGR